MENNLKSIMGFAGAMLLIVGVFMPIVHVPMRGAFAYVDGDGKILLVFGVIVIIITFFKKYGWNFLFGLMSLGMLLNLYYQVTSEINKLVDKAAISASATSAVMVNKFAGMIQFQFGFYILLLGSLLIIISSVIRSGQK